MLGDLSRCRLAVLQHVFDEIDAPARRIEFIAEQHIGWTGRSAASAMDARPEDPVGFGKFRFLELLGCEIRLHSFKRPRTCGTGSAPASDRGTVRRGALPPQVPRAAAGTGNHAAWRSPVP